MPRSSAAVGCAGATFDSSGKGQIANLNESLWKIINLLRIDCEKYYI